MFYFILYTWTEKIKTKCKLNKIVLNIVIVIHNTTSILFYPSYSKHLLNINNIILIIMSDLIYPINIFLYTIFIKKDVK